MAAYGGKLFYNGGWLKFKKDLKDRGLTEEDFKNYLR